MNILFLTLLDFESLDERNIYTDLLREFVKNKHHVHVVSPVERKKNVETNLIEHKDYKILKLQIGNMQKTNLIEKGISTLTLETKFVQGIKQYYADVKFDLVIYSTPPITLQKAVGYVKKRDGALTYLLLKDIFPQNAVDLGMLTKTGLKSILYKYFKKKEKDLYDVSDVIGCMSKANVEFIKLHNPNIEKSKIEVCPNSIDLSDEIVNEVNRNEVRKKYNIPLEATVYIYGGNLGKPQAIDFLIQCLKQNKYNSDVYFVTAGSGTEYNKLKFELEDSEIHNAILFPHLSKQEYEAILNSCDVGLIFLDKRFTIPNFPSRILSYMQASMPVLAATDRNTDIGEIIEEGKFGYWCESSDLEKFNELLEAFSNLEDLKVMGRNAREYLEAHYTTKISYNIIMKHFEKGSIN